MRSFSNYWNFVNKAILGKLIKKVSFFEKWISSCELVVSVYQKPQFCDPMIIPKKIKMTHAQPTQKGIILPQIHNWLNLVKKILIHKKVFAVTLDRRLVPLKTSSKIQLVSRSLLCGPTPILWVLYGISYIVLNFLAIKMKNYLYFKTLKKLNSNSRCR